LSETILDIKNQPAGKLWSPSDQIVALSDGSSLEHLRFPGTDNATHLIDCDSQPFIPKDWSVLSDSEQLPNRVRGQIVFDPDKIRLFLAAKQQNDLFLIGNKLRLELLDKLVLSANFLDYLLAHPGIIPPEFKGRKIFFWGTIYRDWDNESCVRCLHSIGSEWTWDKHWLDLRFYSIYPTILFN
jgi:hypothetical protein